MRPALASVSAGLFLAASIAIAQAPPPQPKGLAIYYVDTEGGQATLFVAPSGESLLVDAGNPGGRDTDRIQLAMADAGVTQIDHLLSTHYHVDHIGGLQELARRVPVRHFYDHGPSLETREQVAGFQAAYAELYGKAGHTVLKPGDKIRFPGVDWQIVTAGGSVLKTAVAGAAGAGRPNPACADFTPKDVQIDPENGASVGSVIAFGKFRTIDLGDLVWNFEGELMCPANRIGAVDLFLSSCHGQDWSNSRALVHGLQPRVIVMNNGTRKGAQVAAFETFESSPGVEDLWQLHWSYNGVTEHNAPGRFIANIDAAETTAAIIANPPVPGTSTVGPAPARTALPPAATAQPGGQPPAAAARGAGPAGGRGNAAAAHSPAYWIKVSAYTDGSFTVTNPRNGFSKSYKPRS